MNFKKRNFRVDFSAEAAAEATPVPPTMAGGGSAGGWRTLKVGYPFFAPPVDVRGLDAAKKLEKLAHFVCARVELRHPVSQAPVEVA